MSIADRIRKADRISTVFTIADIQTLLTIPDKKTLYNALSYAVKQQELLKISEGIFSFDKEYSRKEFANKYRKPSYISLYTVLQDTGVVFQPYTSIFVITNRSEEKVVDNQKYIYRKIKDYALLNPLGIRNMNKVQTATPERAICDKLYLDGDEHFDNLRNIDWKLMKAICSTVYFNNKVILSFITNHTNESIRNKKT